MKPFFNQPKEEYIQKGYTERRDTVTELVFIMLCE